MIMTTRVELLAALRNSHAEFQAAIHAIAAQHGRRAEVVYFWWRRYSAARREQAELIEFEDWYGSKLGMARPKLFEGEDDETEREAAATERG